jgi:hypothetical protein
VAKSPFRPTADLLPDDTAAVLVADPKAYWAMAETDHPFVSRVRRNADLLTRGFGFDPRKFDRVTVAFQPDMSKCVAAGEGEVLSADTFRKELERLPLINVEKGANDVQVVVRGKKDGKANPFNTDRRVLGALLPPPTAYLIGSDEADLGKLSKSVGARPAPAGVDPKLLDAVTDVTKSSVTPLVFFAASGGCKLPFAKGTAEPLSAHGVELLTLSGAAADDKRVRLTLTAVGPDASRLNKFVGMELPGLLEALAGKELAKPLADPITEAVLAAAPADAPGGRKRLTVEFTWEWAAVHPAAEKLIPPPLDRKD